MRKFREFVCSAQKAKRLGAAVSAFASARNSLKAASRDQMILSLIQLHSPLLFPDGFTWDSATMATEASSTLDNTEIFQQLESYPWGKDAEFQVRLFTIFELPTSLGIARQAQSSQTG